MPDLPTSLLSRIYAKTAQGQQEIQSRTLGLTPLARRVLVLVDGHRSGKDLAAFVPGNDIEVHLTELLTRECIAAVGTAAAPAPAPAPAAAAAWAHALETNSTGKKRLPELRDKLFAVL